MTFSAAYLMPSLDVTPNYKDFLPSISVMILTILEASSFIEKREKE